MVENLPVNAGGVRDAGSVPGSGRSSEGGHGNPLQYSYLENPIDTGAWRATVHRVTKSWIRLKQLSTHACRLWGQLWILGTSESLNRARSESELTLH